MKMPTIAQILAEAKKVAAAMNKKHQKVIAKRKSRAIKKAKAAKPKKSKGFIGLKALGL
jgi:hypothetical protein